MIDTYDPKKMRERLMSAMRSKGYSMRKTSLESGLSETAFHGIVKLGRDPGTQTLAKICKTLDISMSWALFGVDVSPEAEEALRLLQENPSKHTAMLQLLRE